MLVLAALAGAAGAWLLYGGLGSGVGAMFERRMGRPTSEAGALRMLAGGGAAAVLAAVGLAVAGGYSMVKAARRGFGALDDGGRGPGEIRRTHE